MNDRILKWKKWKKNEWMRGWLKERDRKTQMNKRCLKERNEKNESMRGWLKGKWKNEWMRGFFFKRKKWKITYKWDNVWKERIEKHKWMRCLKEMRKRMNERIFKRKKWKKNMVLEKGIEIQSVAGILNELNSVLLNAICIFISSLDWR